MLTSLCRIFLFTCIRFDKNSRIRLSRTLPAVQKFNISYLFTSWIKVIPLYYRKFLYFNFNRTQCSAKVLDLYKRVSFFLFQIFFSWWQNGGARTLDACTKRRGLLEYSKCDYHSNSTWTPLQIRQALQISGSLVLKKETLWTRRNWQIDKKQHSSLINFHCGCSLPQQYQISNRWSKWH